MDFLYALEKVACGDIWPDLTLILDISAEEGMKRANARRNNSIEPDRFEKEDMTAQEMRREAFRVIAENEPNRCKLINASGTEKEVAKRIWKVVEPVLKTKAV
jgi:dTMP kinase